MGAGVQGLLGGSWDLVTKVLGKTTILIITLTPVETPISLLTNTTTVVIIYKSS